MKISKKQFYFISVILLFPALLINLGMMPFIDDEAIRALVALEMKLSGNYITPTMLGAYYYNKPPLYNWILLVFFKLFGTFDEFSSRFATVTFLGAYAWTIYYFFKKYFSKQTAFLTAFALITCGRVLFYDSLLGLIDIAFSWVIFTQFMLIYEYFKQERWKALYLCSYFLAAIGFLLKGLPAIVFLGFTLLAVFLFHRKFKKLFSWAHVSGGLLFFCIVGTYYLVYNQYNSLENVFTTLFTESSKRTAVNYGIGKTVMHFFTFPFEMIYHFLPWSIFILFFIKRDLIKVIQRNEFVTYLMLVFFTNIWVYWLSVEVYPRYLLMFAPLIFGTFFYLAFETKDEHYWQSRTLFYLVASLAVLLSLGSFAPLFLEQTQERSHLWLKTILPGIGLLFFTFQFIKYRITRWLSLIVILLIIRVVFNWFVLPDRKANDWGETVKNVSIQFGKEYKNDEIFVYRGVDMQPANNFYITRARERILTRKYPPLDSSAYYIYNHDVIPEVPHDTLFQLKMRHGKHKTRYLIRFK